MSEIKYITTPLTEETVKNLRAGDFVRITHMFKPDSSCPALLFDTRVYTISNTGLSPSVVKLPNLFFYSIDFLL